MGHTTDTTPPRRADTLQRRGAPSVGEAGEEAHGETVLLLGGARSGKSSMAVDLAKHAGGPVTFIATAEPGDEEMAIRIAEHRRQRPVEWATIESPLDIGVAIADAPDGDTVILDCLTLWVANLLGAGFSGDEVRRRARDVSRAVALRGSPVITVSNEVGSGIVPSTPLGRDYRDVLGDVNRIWADTTERVYLLVAGRVLELSRLEGKRNITS